MTTEQTTSTSEYSVGSIIGGSLASITVIAAVGYSAYKLIQYVVSD